MILNKICIAKCNYIYRRKIASLLVNGFFNKPKMDFPETFTKGNRFLGVGYFFAKIIQVNSIKIS